MIIVVPLASLSSFDNLPDEAGTLLEVDHHP